MTTTCPFCGAAADPRFLPKRHADDAIAYACGTVAGASQSIWRSDECHAAEVAKLTKERDEARSEVARLKAGGCARDQRTTQFCAEAVALQERVKSLEEGGDKAIQNSYYPDRLAVWTHAKEAKP